MTHYRFVMFGRRKTLWYETREEAETAAEKAGMGHRDRFPPHRFYAGVGVEMEKRD